MNETTCGICLKSFSTKYVLKKHVECVHPSPAVAENSLSTSSTSSTSSASSASSTSSTSFACSSCLCSYHTPYKSDWRRHTRTCPFIRIEEKVAAERAEMQLKHDKEIADLKLEMVKLQANNQMLQELIRSMKK
jgi:hypothetical protein